MLSDLQSPQLGGMRSSQHSVTPHFPGESAPLLTLALGFLLSQQEIWVGVGFQFLGAHCFNSLRAKVKDTVFV